MGLPLFEGTTEHGYARRTVESTQQCPRCRAATRQCNARFICATDIAPRVMLAPAGSFCTACPAVVIDEEIIAMSVKEGYRFRCVVGIDRGEKTPPDLFRTWNGEASAQAESKPAVMPGAQPSASFGAQDEFLHRQGRSDSSHAAA